MTTTALNLKPGLQEVLVTPDIAKSWLCTHADFQRSISPVTVRKYADEMRRGQWKYVPSLVIALTDEFQVVDGQHRLAAIIESGVPQLINVHYGADPSSFSVIDRGRPRTLPQIAEMAGATFSAGYHVSAVSSLLWKHDVLRSVSYSWAASDIVDVLEYFKPQLELTFPEGYSGSSQIRMASIRGAFLRAFISRPEKKHEISEFLKVCVTGMPEPGMTEKDWKAPLMLRNIIQDFTGKLDGSRTFGGSNNKHRLWIVTLKCLRAHLAGNPIGYKSNAARHELKTQPFPIQIDEKPHNQPFKVFASQIKAA